MARAGLPTLLLLLAAPAAADYQSDRGLSSPPMVQRLYLGRRETNRCLSWRVEDCIRREGEPQERRRVSDHEEQLVYYGKKQLYRGSGDANSAVGPERHEYTVRDGKVVHEFEVVQVLEHGYPWMPRPVDHPSCEVWGEKNTLVCIGVTPEGPVPPMPKPTKPPLDFGCAPGAVAPAQGTQGVGDLDREALRWAVVKETDALVGRENFTLSWGEPERKGEALFYLGQPFDAAESEKSVEVPFVTVSCALAVHFGVDASANVAGTLTVGVCDRMAELTWNDICQAKSRLGQVLSMLGVTRVDGAPKGRGIPPEHRRVSGRLEMEYFSVVLVGHGIAALPTLVFTHPDARFAVVIQHADENDLFCKLNPPSRFCTDRLAVLTELGVRLAHKFLHAS